MIKDDAIYDRGGRRLVYRIQYGKSKLITFENTKEIKNESFDNSIDLKEFVVCGTMERFDLSILQESLEFLTLPSSVSKILDFSKKF